MSETLRNERIEAHWKANYKQLVKKFTRAAGTVWDAEEVVQSGYERALRYYNEDAILDFEPWIGNIIRNALIDKINESRGIIHEELDEFDFEAISTIPPIQIRNSIRSLIALESQDNQPILELHFIKGYSAREIYEHNAISYPNTRKIIQRFRDKLKKELNSE